MTYISGFLTPVENARRADYIQSARDAYTLFKEYGALAQMEAWGDNVPDGKVTDFWRAVALKEGETVCLGWIVWPDKATADACEASMDRDDRWQQMSMPFDVQRMIFGGFQAVLEQTA